ncbi:MAG: hypothetical protein MI919_26750, partial [Holophagales bacterium]|nr:hypothetical protein [Holophagales bacterium]
PILEKHGVDLFLAGHSHSYERSFLLHGHYGVSDTLEPSMILDAGDGREDGDGPYRKARRGQGMVFVVAGSSGKLATGKLEHPIMVESYMTLGSVVVDIDGPRLDLAFVTADGEVADQFTLLHE